MYDKFISDLNVFRTFAAIMRSIPVKICTVVLVIWYLMSIIGFGVHTCSGDGHSFVTTFVTGSECADIHPEHHCDEHDHGCCHSEKEDDCCTDDFHVLSVTGLASNDQNNRYCDDSFFVHSLCEAVLYAELPYFYPDEFLLEDLYEPDSGSVARDVQSFFNIWRI